MRKRIAAFVGLLGVTGAVVGFAAAGTGAYFSDSESGTVTAKTGTLDIAAGESESLTVTFDDLYPGESQTNDVTITNNGSRDVDLYLKITKPVVSGGPLSGDDLNELFVYAADYMWAGTANSPTQVISLGKLAEGASTAMPVEVALQESAGNEWQDRTATFDVTVIAQQEDAPLPS
jgi:Camelysin metallo-endopeptidase